MQSVSGTMQDDIKFEDFISGSKPESSIVAILSLSKQLKSEGSLQVQHM